MADVKPEYKYLNGNGLSKVWALIKEKFASKNHATTSTENGVSTTTMYGHVKLTDNPNIDDTTSAIVPRQSAVAPKNHASSATTYGVGSSSAYGHVKLLDTVNTSVHGAISSTALNNYFYMTEAGSVTPASLKSAGIISTTTGFRSWNSIKLMQNADGTLFKVYGELCCTGSFTFTQIAIPGTSNYGFKIGKLNKKPSSTYFIQLGFSSMDSNATVANTYSRGVYVATDGYVYGELSGDIKQSTLSCFYLYLPPVLLTNMSFNDTPSN